MKKVLILAYDFPPYVSVGGLRPFNWYRYLKEFDIEPIVITRQWENKHGNHLDYIDASSSNKTIIETTDYGVIVRTAYNPNLSNRLLLKYGKNRFKIVRKIISGFHEFGQFILPVGTKRQIYIEAKKYLKSNKVDFIIATGEPFVLFQYANELSKSFNTPWVADYRDPWSQSIHLQKTILLKIWSEFFERKIVKKSILITTANDNFKIGLRNFFTNQKIEIISNGYSTNMVSNSESVKQNSKKLTISFAGTIYEWHPIDSFLKTCNEFNKLHGQDSIHLCFYGMNDVMKIKELVETDFKFLKSSIEFFPAIQNEFLGKHLRKANLFLLFNDYSIIGTKIYTYLGLKRKIVFCFENDIVARNLKEKYFTTTLKNEKEDYQADLINQTNSGVIVRDSEHLLEVLEELYTEFQETGQIACNSVGVENYSRKIQVEKLAELIKSI